MGFWARLFGNRVDACRKHAGGVVHSGGCRPGRPRCKWARSPQTCYCNAAPWPHRRGSLKGCREGGIPDAILNSPSYRYASKRRKKAKKRR